MLTYLHASQLRMRSSYALHLRSTSLTDCDFIKTFITDLCVKSGNLYMIILILVNYVKVHELIVYSMVRNEQHWHFRLKYHDDVSSSALC